MTDRPDKSGGSGLTAPRLVEQARLLADAGDLEGAQGLLRQALAESPECWPAYVLLATVLAQRGRRAAVGRVLARMVTLRPTDPDLWVSIGQNHIYQGDWDPALDAFRHARRLRGNDVQVLNQQAMAALSAQRLDAFREAHDPMLREFPNHSLTHLMQGHLAKIEGQAGMARSAYEQALLHDPTLSDAMYNLADVAPPPSDSMLGRQIRHYAYRPDLTNLHRANAMFALGRIFEAEQRVDAAFEHYVRGNNAARESLLELGIRYDRMAEEGRFEIARKLYTSTRRTAHSSFDAMIRPIFIVGLPRSGTTLVEQILAGHSLVSAGGELPYIPQLASEFEESLKGQDSTDWDAPSQARCLTALQQRYIEQCFERNLDRPYVTDKLTFTFQSLGFVRLLFPNAIIVHCTRDPMATAWSLYRSHFGYHLPYYNAFDTLAHQMGLYQRYMRHWERVLDAPLVRVQYDDLVADPASAIGSLLAACGLSAESRCFGPELLTHPVFTASQLQVRQPITSAAIDRWRVFEPHLLELRAHLNREIAHAAAGPP